MYQLSGVPGHRLGGKKAVLILRSDHRAGPGDFVRVVRAALAGLYGFPIDREDVVGGGTAAVCASSL
jgi:hypothetical protein